MTTIPSAISANTLTDRIHLIHGHKVLLSSDLADLYMVEHRALIQAVKRNIDRFPEDFMFQLSESDWNNLKSQIVISSWGGSRKPPYAFTEQGVAMLSSVLRSDRAVQVIIEMMRAFVRLRNVLSEHRELAARLDVLEQRYDENFKIVFDAIRQLMAPPDKKKTRHWVPGRPGVAHKILRRRQAFLASWRFQAFLNHPLLNGSS